MQTSDILMSFAVAFAIGTKITLLARLFPADASRGRASQPWFFLIAALICALYTDIAWALKLLRSFNIISISYPVIVFALRLAWAFVIAQYQFLTLFVSTLIKRKPRIGYLHKALVAVSTSLISYCIVLAFSSHTLTSETMRGAAFLLPLSLAPTEVIFMRLVPFFILFIFIAPSLIKARFTMRTEKLPRILRTQLSLLSCYLYLPHLIGEILFATDTLIRHNFNPHILCSTTCFFINGTIMYCVLKLMRIRFLNLAPRVMQPTRKNVMADFRVSLEQLGNTTSIYELNNIVKTFFHDAFSIPLHATELHLRKHHTHTQSTATTITNRIETTVEQHLYLDAAPVCQAIHEQRILLYDEIDFSSFYTASPKKNTLLTFLNEINTDIFLPIIKEKKVIGYILVSHNARPQRCYGDSEHDEMLIFASYLSNIMHLIQNRNLELIIHREHATQLALTNANQLVKQYRESIRTFINTERTRLTGVLIYRAKRFHYANAAAKQIINVDLNTKNGHHLTHAIKQLLQHVATYQSPHSTLTTNGSGERIIVRATPSLEHGGTVLTTRYPDIADLIAEHGTSLAAHQTPDLLLYLQTTRAGNLINTLLPSNSETIINFKINLLQAALHQRALLIHADEDDLANLANVIHHISERKSVQTISRAPAPYNVAVAISIFGVNPTLDTHTPTKPLLETLDQGTLLIKDIHYATRETQEMLAEFIETGLFRPLKSDMRQQSTTRIICTTFHNVKQLVDDNLFSSRLYHALKKDQIVQPTPVTLAEDELLDLIDGFCKQLVTENPLRNLLKLSTRDTEAMLRNRPESVHHLKTKIQTILVERSKKSEIYNNISFDRGYNLADPDLVEAARLGKHALRDQKVLALLWDKFKNQNKIASLLGVNRSSVSRRMKDYGLQ